MSDDPMVAIGLEVHIQVNTRTKAFCGCPVDVVEPNTAICPTCLGQPGALPAPNREMISGAVKLARALNSETNHISRFARKHYLYPDLPKGYQITQFDEPLAFGGGLTILSAGEEKTIRLRRIHVEEDAAKLIHDEPWIREGRSYVDFNRCGIPLIEVVTEPDLRTGEEAVQFVRRLQILLRWLDISDALPEKGQLRFDANVSVRFHNDEDPVITEIKNLNSFSSLRKSLEFEIRRKIKRYESGSTDTAETVLWDESRRETRTMRSKETLSDYRYIPDPDLPVLRIHDHEVREVEDSLPELPWQARERLVKEYGISVEHADRMVKSPETVSYLDTAVNHGANVHEVIRWMTGELRHLQKQANAAYLSDIVTPETLADLLIAEQEERLTGATIVDIIYTAFVKGVSIDEMKAGFDNGECSSQEDIRDAVDSAMREYTSVVDAITSGDKPGGIDFLIGHVLKTVSGTIDPKRVRSEILARLETVD